MHSGLHTRATVGRAWYRHGLMGQQAALTALLFSVGVTFNGLNNAFGHPVTFLLCGAALAFALFVETPPAAFWSRLLPILTLVLVAQLWVMTPLWLELPGVRYAVPDVWGGEFIGAGGMVAAFAVGACISARRGAPAAAIDWLIIFACANAVVGLVVREMGDSLHFDLWRGEGSSRFTGTVSNPNVAGAYFGMMALLALGRAMNAAPAGEGPIAQAASAARWIAVLLCGGACAITASRSAVVATAVAMLAVAVVALVRQRAVRAGVLVLLGLILIAGAGLTDTLMGRIGLLGEQSTGRGAIWSHDWTIVQASPWFGHGFGSFSAVSLRLLDDPRLAQELWTVNSAHNLIFQLLIEGGFVYLALLAGAAMLIGARIVSNLKHLGAGDWRAGAVGAIGVVLACAMVDIALDVPAISALTLFLAGMLWERPQFGLRSGSSRRT